MVYTGYQQNTGGYNYYFSGLKSTNRRGPAKELAVAPPVSKDNVPETTARGLKAGQVRNTKPVIMEENTIEAGLKGKKETPGVKLEIAQ